jgi:hypothetical protein
MAAEFPWIGAEGDDVRGEYHSVRVVNSLGVPLMVTVELLSGGRDEGWGQPDERAIDHNFAWDRASS